MRPHTPSRHRRSLWALGALALLSPLLVALPSSPAVAAAAPPDGASQSTAAASCWEIKQNKPAATDGVYWLQTPQLIAPRKFYCDMTIDGGGWVLIGRGREGWKDNYNGRGTSDQVAETVTGPSAFSTRQLDSKVVDALLGGRRVDSMTDGVRIRRALDANGAQFQETRFTFRFRDRWAWSFGAGFPITTAKVGTATVYNTTTRQFGSGSGTNVVSTFDSSNNKYVRGFNYGANVFGSTAASSYLYSENPTGTYATPFSQVFLRPKLLTSDLSYPTVDQGGTAATTQPPIPQNGALPTSWGVTGTGAAGTGENATEVQAFAQIGNTMYVGGNFTTVQKGAGATGADVVSQPYLAAFDATTGAYISSFKPPALNNQVKALAALPGGKLAVGGEFTTVDGASRPGLVVVDGSTGAVDPAWTTSIVNKISGGTVSIRALGVGGDYLYVGGAMSHFKTGTSEVYAKNAGRIKISTRVPDKVWNPEFNGTVTALDISQDGARAYFSGYFTLSRTEDAQRGAAFSTASGAARITPTWTPTFSTAGSARYQQAIKEVGSRVWLGGSQHSMFGYDRDTFALQTADITKAGGDVQAIEGGNGFAFAGCHCEHWNYDTANYDSTSPGSTNITWTQADKIYYVGAWDAVTGKYVPDFTPEMRARSGMGVWALKVASDGTLWAGGSLQSGVSTSGGNQWIGGFARFAKRPSTAPGAPSGASATLAGDVATVSWDPSSSSGITYEVMRNDRVVATTTSRTVTVPGSTTADKFFVRAADDYGNRSASTAGFSAVVPPTTTTLVPAQSQWSYLFSTSETAPATWKSAADGTEGWGSGPAPLGWGSASIATNIDVPSGQTRPLTSYFRHTFDVTDPAVFTHLALKTRADDGIAVYVNGVEVGRSNLPAGNLAANTYALNAPSTTSAVANQVTYDVPTSLLTAGTNTIAVEVHSNYKATPNSSMDLTLVGTS